VCIWSQNLKLQRVINTKDFCQNFSWVSDAVFMHDHGKLVVVTDDCQYVQSTPVYLLAAEIFC
jgi:hypothetical protein